MMLKVRLIPDATENEVVCRIGSVLRVKVAAPASDEAANTALKRYLAEFFEVPSKGVNILRGANGREKTIEINGKTEEDLKQVMDSIP
jgi:uncharacterized protein (TIGR00251 family)